MQKTIAGVLRVDPDVVNVKVKSGEGLDAVGREEAIAAHAVCLIAAASPA
jgi:2C-methyl-D-erythritol 2,4-cyclodiphosphate synthase